MLCDVDFVLLRMIFFVLTCEAGRCRTWVFGQYLPFVFAFFFACRCCIDVLTGAESAEMKSSSSSRTASSYSLVSG